MPQRAVIADPFRFAAEGRSLSGKVAVADLRRLADMLVDVDGDVEFSVSGELGSEREPRLRLTATGVFQLRCQRCLGPMVWPLEMDVLLQLVRPGEVIPEDELEIEEFDSIEADADLDVVALLEDEIVLAAPVAPRHENCDAPRPSGGVEKESPFAALAKLRKGDGAK